MLPFRSLVALLAVAGVALAAAGPAHGAEITRKKAMWGPLIAKDGSSMIPVYAELGVGIYQMRLSWRDTAPSRPDNPRDPSDPVYDWRESIDYAIREAEKYGMELMVQVSFSPTWASGNEAPFRAPKRVQDFADFMEAAARRYPEVGHWAIWSEPNRSTGYSPPTSDGASDAKQKRQRARHYARLLDAAYARLKRVSRSNKVIGGNSYDAAGVAPGFQPARQWIRNLKLRNGKPPRMDLYGHNPFSSRRPDLKQRPRNPLGLDFADTDDLIKVVNKRLRRSKRRKLKVFLSEYALPTDTDSEIFPGFFVSRETQARWITDALRIARRTKGIYTFGYYKLADEAATPSIRARTYGLITVDGERKPAYFAWRDG